MNDSKNLNLDLFASDNSGASEVVSEPITIVQDTRLSGAFEKMTVELIDGQAHYNLKLDNQLLNLNLCIGRQITIDFSGAIHCCNCGKSTKKSFNQGFCWTCFKSLACCDSCIMSPEKCHYAQGTCREPQWGERFCMTDHVVYLANSSGLKVGITRSTQIPTRWIDQGAIQALPIARVATRRLSGLVEDMFRSEVNDRTNWRAMLKGDVEPLDMLTERDRLLEQFGKRVQILRANHGMQSVELLPDADAVDISYPLPEPPKKVTSLSLDKQSKVEGVLKGIKGQYLVLDTGVINIRKFTAYQVSVQIH